jgi:type IV secretory pathway VirB6-like protein
MLPETWADFFSFLSTLMTAHASMFETLGTNLFRGFAVILIVWFGVKSALASASGGHSGFHFERFASLLMTIAFGDAMITYYSHPLPGLGFSFYHLIVDQGTNLANELNHGIVTEVTARLNSIYYETEQPGLSLAINILEVLRYEITVIALEAAQIAVFVVIAFGYVASAVAVMLGPIFIPFFIVPKLEWLFWGWLKSLLQYAFYPVVANAYIFVFGQLLIHFVDAHPPPYDGATLAVLFLPLLFLLIAFTWGVLLIPSLVNSLFAGRSGESAVPGRPNE